MEAADRVIAVSNLTRNIIVTRYGIPAEKVVTVHNAVRFAENSGKVPERGVKDKIVTFLGRITYQKGPDYFVEAAAKVLKRVPDVRFVMAGSGDMMNHVIRRPVPLHGIPPRRGCAQDVPAVGRICDAFGVGALRHFAPRSDAVERSGHHLEAERRGRGAGLRRESRLLGRGRPCGRHLRTDQIPRPLGHVRLEGARRGHQSQMERRCGKDQDGLRGRDRRE